MGIALVVVASAISLALIVRHFPRLPDMPTRFLLLAIWLRYVLAAMPEQTAVAYVAGFSINALSSIAVAGAAILIVGRRLLRLRHLALVYAIMALSVFTGLLHGVVVGMINDIVKWTYFIGLALLVFRAVSIFGMDRVMRAILCAFATPLLLQAASVALGAGKFSEFDGSTAYIGGYFHEGAFSDILLTFIFALCLVQWRHSASLPALAAIGFAALLLANYRTAIIAAVPMAVLLGALAYLALFGRSLRPAALAVAALVGLALLPAGWALLPDRITDIGVVVVRFENLIKPPDEYTAADRLLFSGRLYTWANYLTAYGRGSTVEHLIGYGPNSWEGLFRFYAHNTYVSYVYEFGVIGLVLLIALFGYNLMIALNGIDGRLALRLAAAQAGLALLNLAHMPLWSIEGLIGYAVVFGATWAMWRPRPLTSTLRPGGAAAPTSSWT